MLQALEGQLGARLAEPVRKPVVKSRIAVDDERQMMALMEWARQHAHLSAGELAKALGVKPQTVGQYRERKRRPGMVFVIRWLRVCGFELEAIQR